MIRSKYQPRMNANRREYKTPTADESAAASLWRDRLQIYADLERDTSRRSFLQHHVAL
jgi:hypothetical protein